MLGEKIVFGRDEQGKPFALRDNCPHRGVPLSGVGLKITPFNVAITAGNLIRRAPAKEYPHCLPTTRLIFRRSKYFNIPVKKSIGTIWVYIPDKKLPNLVPKEPPPDLLLARDKKFLHVETVTMPADIDHSVIGLIDPSHVTFVHQSWYWRSAKKLKIKEKKFEPTAKGFKMVRHAPSSNSKGYSVLKGGTSTEITFEIPAIRTEHILVGEKHEVISITVLTPINENQTELTHIFYSSPCR